MIRFTFLSENKTDDPRCNAEHGLSIYIETEEKNILFDTGASPLFLENAKRIHVDLTKADACVISHGHYDHTEGVPAFCRINDRSPIYIHRKAFGTVYGTHKGEIEKEPCSILWSEFVRDELKDRLMMTDGPLWLTDNIVISGTIPAELGEMTETFYEKQADGSFIEDAMEHEQFLAIRNGEQGIFLFSGCSHKGVIPAIWYARELFPGERIYCLVAGMHLYGATDEVRAQVTKQLIEEGIEVVMPVHCTGIEAICMLKNAMGKACIPAAAGGRYAY